MKKLSILTLALGVALSSTAAHAEYNPRKGPYDSRVRVATYRDGEVYRLHTSLTHVTSVEFGQGEKIRSIVAGDTEAFKLDGVPGGRAFVIKPAAKNVRTNITVYTNQRSYYFAVTEGSRGAQYAVRFKYPADKKRPRDAVAKRAPNYSYGASGQSEITPIEIWDDGTFTYFRFRSNAPVPAIFRWSNGSERTVNTMATDNDAIRVSGVNKRWVLRLGDQEICIEAMPREAWK